MVLIFNVIGLVIIVLTFIFKVIFDIVSANEFVQIAGIFIGSSLIILDVGTRIIIKKFYPNNKYKLKGGTIFFIPVYIWGILFVIFTGILKT